MNLSLLSSAFPRSKVIYISEHRQQVMVGLSDLAITVADFEGTVLGSGVIAFAWGLAHYRKRALENSGMSFTSKQMTKMALKKAGDDVKNIFIIRNEARRIERAEELLEFSSEKKKSERKKLEKLESQIKIENRKIDKFKEDLNQQGTRIQSDNLQASTLNLILHDIGDLMNDFSATLASLNIHSRKVLFFEQVRNGHTKDVVFDNLVNKTGIEQKIDTKLAEALVASLEKLELGQNVREQTSDSLTTPPYIE